MNLKRYFIFFILFALTGISAQTASLETTFSLKEINNTYIPYQNGMPVPSFDKQSRTTMFLHGTWKKQRFAADDNITLAKRDDTGYNNLIAEAQDRHLPTFDDSGWEDKTIPGVENEIYEFPKVPEYYEDGVWYRISFDVSSTFKGKFVKLNFLSVNYVADVWLNGEYLGYHEGGYTPFAFNVSDKLKFNEKNVLAVRVDNPEWGTRNDIVPYYEVDWFNYTGIIHDVYLEASDPVSVLRADIVPLDVNGNISTQIILNNNDSTDRSVKMSISIFNTDIEINDNTSELASDLKRDEAVFTGDVSEDILIASDTFAVIKGNIKITNPLLWSPQNPNLYILQVTLTQNDTVIDQFHSQFGIRTIERIKDKVLLNKQPVFLTGVARHEDHPVHGRSIPADVIYSDMHLVKDVNANLLRTAHYPNHPFTYQIADRLGIAVMEEIPVWWFDEPLPWQIQNDQRHIHEQMFKEMVYKDFNRPSVFLWSTSNECRDVPNRKIFVEKIQSEMKNKIKDGRLVSQSAAADRPGPEDDSQKACDVAGWTMYYGVFYGAANAIQGGTNNFLINAKVKQPETPVMATEFGTWSGEDNSLFNNQVKIFNETFAAFQNFAAINKSGKYNISGHLMAVTWWCIFDWYSHGHPRGYQSMGLYSMDRTFAKPVAQTLIDAYAPYYNLGGTVTSVKDKKEEVVPIKFELGQNYPNPFNPVSTISYSIPSESHVSLIVYSLLGKKVATLVDEQKSAGIYNVDFNAANLSSGIYFYRLQMNNQVITKKLTILK